MSNTKRDLEQRVRDVERQLDEVAGLCIRRRVRAT